MKKLLICLTLLLFVSVPVLAESKGMHGSISCRYELADDYPGQVWGIDLYYSFNDWLSVGTTLKTFTNGYDTYFGAIPAYVPNGQLYEVYFNFDITDNLAVKLSQWCNHPIYSGGSLQRTQIPQGVYVEASYKW